MKNWKIGITTFPSPPKNSPRECNILYNIIVWTRKPLKYAKVGFIYNKVSKYFPFSERMQTWPWVWEKNEHTVKGGLSKKKTQSWERKFEKGITDFACYKMEKRKNSDKLSRICNSSLLMKNIHEYFFLDLAYIEGLVLSEGISSLMKTKANYIWSATCNEAQFD